MSRASSLSLKEKRKRNIKFRKIDKRKRKILVSKVFHNTVLLKVSGMQALVPLTLVLGLGV